VRPGAARTIFCDGGVDETFREGLDLELSHWIPNRSPAQFKADTSTEICMNFAGASGLDQGFDLIVNNHVDVDGVLAVFVLLSPDCALDHRRTIVQAAEMGDFWSWGDRPAQALFQALALLQRRLKSSGADAQDVYAQCFELTRAVLSGEACAEAADGLAVLEEAIAKIETGQIARTSYNERFVHYAVPRRLAERDLHGALHVPDFNVPLARPNLLPPYARSRWDDERVQLVSVEAGSGWYYDLWYPGYTWAETPRRWRPPGVTSAGSSNVHIFDHPALSEAVGDLSRMETADGQWIVARRLSPFSSLAGRNFPVVLSFLKEDLPAPSSLAPSIVAPRLASAFPDLGPT
jgi:hypothetical protein